MDSKSLLRLLSDVKAGKISAREAFDKLRLLPFEDIRFAKIDHHRSIRTSIPEVIFAHKKKKQEILAIAQAMVRKTGRLLITRATEDIMEALNLKGAMFYPSAGIISYGEEKKKKGDVLIVSAGTSDIPVADEAAITASFLGSRTERLFDVGVAGIHRVLEHSDRLLKSRVIVVVAGMEGALPSVVGGLTDKPVIAVPTSVGYGTSLGGLTALFAMLNSCVPGIAVVNIDNGFGAGCLAHKINISGIKTHKRG
jgi:NCAIR mutase (PurE)-related protein